MMDSTYVQKIADLGAAAENAQGKTLKIGDRTFSTVALTEVQPPRLPEPKHLSVHTLSGLAAYVQENRDELNLEECLVHVTGPDQVVLASRTLGEHHQRFYYVSAKPFNRFEALPSFQFGRFTALADMTIALLALFEPTSERAQLLQILGTVKVEEGVQQEDDGVTQQVTARKGVRLVSTVPVPSPITLSPFRTFSELAQPKSPYVVRLQERGAGVEVALFEADGGAWKLEAIRSAAEWLSMELPSDLAIIA